MPAPGQYRRGLEEWSAKRTKMVQLTLEPPDWRALRLLATERNQSLQACIGDVVHDRMVEKAALIAELAQAV